MEDALNTTDCKNDTHNHPGDPKRWEMALGEELIRNVYYMLGSSCSQHRDEMLPTNMFSQLEHGHRNRGYLMFRFKDTLHVLYRVACVTQGIWACPPQNMKIVNYSQFSQLASMLACH